MLKPMACVAGILAVLIISAGADDATPSIKEVMGKLHKGTSSPLAKLKTALKADTPDWKAVQNLSKDFVTLGACLAENKPPRGDESAYEQLANSYYENAKVARRRRQGRGQGLGAGRSEQDRGLVQDLPRGPQEAMKPPGDTTIGARMAIE